MQIDQRAVIYCRVSSIKQVSEGSGLASQETRCREYATAKGYEVLEVFRDEGLSGKLMDRPQMRAMLAFLGRYRKEGLIVIIDDISRLARDIVVHVQLRSEIKAANATLKSPSIEFGEDSDSKFIENVLASAAAHQREKNAEQVKNRMRARLQQGYWCFHPPPGYVYKRAPGHGKLLVKDEPVASTIADALEAFASGFLQTKSEIKRFLESSPHFPKDRNGGVHYCRVKDALTKPLYAGFIDRPEWGIVLVKGKHEPLISYETFQVIQKRLSAKATAPTRKDIGQDFPLRGFVTCGCCGTPLTSCWSKGRTAMHPYYHCRKKGCKWYGKSIRREKIEGEFESLLGKMRPSTPLLAAAAHILRDLWDERHRNAARDADVLRMERTQIERKSEQLMDRILETESQSLVCAYETRLRKLEADRIVLDERIARCGSPITSFEETFRTAFEFLSDPQKLWHSGKLEHQRTVLKLAFSDRLPYDRTEGFRTGAKPLPFLLLEQLGTAKSGMVDLSVETSNCLFNTLERWEALLTKLAPERGFAWSSSLDQGGLDEAA